MKKEIAKVNLAKSISFVLLALLIIGVSSCSSARKGLCATYQTPMERLASVQGRNMR